MTTTVAFNSGLNATSHFHIALKSQLLVSVSKYFGQGIVSTLLFINLVIHFHLFNQGAVPKMSALIAQDIF